SPDGERPARLRLRVTRRRDGRLEDERLATRRRRKRRIAGNAEGLSPDAVPDEVLAHLADRNAPEEELEVDACGNRLSGRPEHVHLVVPGLRDARSVVLAADDDVQAVLRGRGRDGRRRLRL